METFLGFDAGGTHTRWAIVDAEGVCRASGEGPAMQVVADGVADVAARLGALCAEVCASHDPVRALAGVAGAGPDVRRTLTAAVGAPIPFSVTGDPEVAAACALADGPGIALWSGTGSFGLARDAAGELLRIGGRGSLLGDDGGAFAMVSAAARAAVRATDGLAPPTALGASLVDVFGASDTRRLGARMQALGTREIAAAFPTVVAVAVSGDVVAGEVLACGAAELAALAEVLAERAGLDRDRVALRLGGGVLHGSSEFQDRVHVALASRGFRSAPLLVARSAAEGAALLASAVHTGRPPLCTWGERGAT